MGANLSNLLLIRKDVDECRIPSRSGDVDCSFEMKYINQLELYKCRHQDTVGDTKILSKCNANSHTSFFVFLR